MKIRFISFIFIFAAFMSFNQIAYGACGNTVAIQSPLSCIIGGLSNTLNETSDGVLDSSVFMRIYGVGSGGLVCEIIPTSAKDTCTGLQIDLTGNGACGLGSGFINGDWFNAESGCEAFSIDSTFPSVTAFISEQLSSAGAPQYLAVAVDERESNIETIAGYNFDADSDFNGTPDGALPRDYLDLPKVDVTGGSENVAAGTITITFTWTGSTYYNQDGSGAANTALVNCGTGGTPTTCNHLIYGYFPVVAYTNLDIATNTCADPADFRVGSAFQLVDVDGDGFTGKLGDIVGVGCLGSATTCGPASITVSTASCDPATGTNCCVVVGVVNAYSVQDPGAANGAPAAFFAGWYTGGSPEKVKIKKGILGPYVKKFTAQLIEIGRFGRAVQLNWQSVTEDGVLGYHVWRSCNNQEYQRITSSPIAAHGSAGSSYSYRDRSLVCAKTGTAYYKVEIVLAGGATQFHDTVAQVTYDLGPPRPSGEVQPPTPAGTPDTKPGTVGGRSKTPPQITSRKPSNPPTSGRRGAVSSGRTPSTTAGLLTQASGRIEYEGRRRFAARISWTSKDETGILGYHVWRACTPGGHWIRITSIPIRSAGRAGSLYTYTDKRINCPIGQNVMYRIEILRRNGASTFHPTVITLPLKIK